MPEAADWQGVPTLVYLLTSDSPPPTSWNGKGRRGQTGRVEESRAVGARVSGAQTLVCVWHAASRAGALGLALLLTVNVGEL